MGTYNWTGSGGDDLWSDPNNWNPTNGPPGASDTADISTDSFSVVVNGTSGVGDLDLGVFFFGHAVGSTVTVGSGGVLDIEGPSSIITASTLQSQPGGLIYLLFSGALTNGGTVLVGQLVNAGGGSSTLYIDGAVTLSGNGTLELGKVGTNLLGLSTGNIANDPNTSDSLINQSNTIAGDGSIALGTFDNQVGGTVAAGLSGTGTLSISAGTFSNEGNLFAEAGSILDLGKDNTNASLANTGTITLDNNSTLVLAGDYTIFGEGGILLAPGTAFGGPLPEDQIVSDGSPAELSLVNQTLKGAGTIGDADLTLINASGTIDADISNEALTVDTGNNTITNGGTLEATNGGGLAIVSHVVNSGIIEADGGQVAIENTVSGPIFPQASIQRSISEPTAISACTHRSPATSHSPAAVPSWKWTPIWPMAGSAAILLAPRPAIPLLSLGCPRRPRECVGCKPAAPERCLWSRMMRQSHLSILPANIRPSISRLGRKDRISSNCRTRVHLTSPQPT